MKAEMLWVDNALNRVLKTSFTVVKVILEEAIHESTIYTNEYNFCGVWKHENSHMN